MDWYTYSAKNRYFPVAQREPSTFVSSDFSHAPSFSCPFVSRSIPLGTSSPGRGRVKSFLQFPHMFHGYQRSRRKDLQVKWHKRTLRKDTLRLSYLSFFYLETLKSSSLCKEFIAYDQVFRAFYKLRLF